MEKDNIVLIGFMGCGKSSVGHNLAYILEKKFIDTDTFIEESSGSSIPEIFLKQGENFFREREREAIAAVCQKHNNIIATGGGSVLDTRNVKNLKTTGCIIYLRATVAHIYNNVKMDQSRPLLKSNNVLETIHTLMNHRAKIYEEAADFIIDVTNKSIVEIVEEIKVKVEDNKTYEKNTCY